MGRSNRAFLATAQETLTPPALLPPTQHLAIITSAAGNNLYHIQYSDNTDALVEMPAKFRSKIWVKRGSFVVVDTEALNSERENKLGGVIVNIVRDEKRWRKMGYWPVEFGKVRSKESQGVVEGGSDEEEEESNVGQMPPSESEEKMEEEEEGKS